MIKLCHGYMDKISKTFNQNKNLLFFKVPDLKIFKKSFNLKLKVSNQMSQRSYSKFAEKANID